MHPWGHAGACINIQCVRGGGQSHKPAAQLVYAAIRSSASKLAVPARLPIEVSEALQVTAHADDAYAKVRSTRGEAIMMYELRVRWQRLLLPRRGRMHDEGWQQCCTRRHCAGTGCATALHGSMLWEQGGTEATAAADA